jgi:uncharacterized 2Fe-2S/4Fe-4S cluster protein (DUF4445 family)
MPQGGCLLALDLGTTTLAGRLLDSDGHVLAQERLLNPQSVLGADIMRRLENAMTGEDLRLQLLLLDGLREIVDSMLRQAGLARRDIRGAAAAGNPGMVYLLRRLPVTSILYPPHRPPWRDAVFLSPDQIDLQLPVPLYIFPLISGYVGGDLVAFLFGQGKVGEASFFLDAGTNGEMALFSGGRWRVTSVAAGPAFEGGGISCGMVAKAGAIHDVVIEDDRLGLLVLGGGPPRGLCGSGLVAALAAALDGGLIDARGSIVDPLEVPTNLSGYIVETASGRALRLYRDAAVDLLLTQQDVRQFQLGKAAVRAGTECLLRRAGLEAADVAQAVLTGAFGFSLSRRVLKRVAMLPENMVEKVRFAEVGVLAGVGRLLCDAQGPDKVQRLAATLQPLPLSGSPAFEKAFIHAMNF